MKHFCSIKQVQEFTRWLVMNNNYSKITRQLTRKDHVWIATSSHCGQYLCRHSQPPSNVHSFLLSRATSGSGCWKLVTHEANNKQIIKLKHRFKHENTFLSLFQTSNEKFEVENNSIYCAVLSHKGQSPSSQASCACFAS